MNSAIIVAAGSSRRAKIDKIFTTINGYPLIYHTIKAFEHSGQINEIIVLTKQESISKLDEIIVKNNFKKISHVLNGGIKRQDSVKIGLDNLSKSSKFVLIHDGARPLVTPKLIKKCIDSLTKLTPNKSNNIKALSCAHKITDTIKKVNSEGIVYESVDRESLWAMETPQIFETKFLRSIYKKIINQNIEITDEVSAVQYFNYKIKIISSDQINIKTTFPEDFTLLKKILTSQIT